MISQLKRILVHHYLPTTIRSRLLGIILLVIIVSGIGSLIQITLFHTSTKKTQAFIHETLPKHHRAMELALLGKTIQEATTRLKEYSSVEELHRNYPHLGLHLDELDRITSLLAGYDTSINVLALNQHSQMLRSSASMLHNVALGIIQTQQTIRESIDTLLINNIGANLDSPKRMALILTLERYRLDPSLPKNQLQQLLHPYPEGKNFLKLIAVLQRQANLERRFAQDIDKASKELDETSRNYLSQVIAAGNIEVQRLNDSSTRYYFLIMVTLLATALLGTGVGWWLITKQITRRLGLISHCLQNHEKPALAKMLQLQGDDEISKMANEVHLLLIDRNNLDETRQELAQINSELNSRNHELMMAIQRQKELAEQTRQSEISLRENEERFRTILESTSVGVFGLDLEGKHTFVNNAAAKMLGYRASDLLKKDSHAIWHHSREDGSSYPVSECPIRTVLTSGQASFGEEVFINSSKSMFHVEYSATPIHENDKLTGVVVTFNDISERRRTTRITQSIITGTSSVTGSYFLLELVKNLAKSLDMRYAFIGEMVMPAMEEVRAVAVWAGDSFGDSFTYRLKGTPCNEVAGEKICYFPDRIQQLFPEDKLLVHMGAVSYVGAPLFSADNAPLGILAVLDDQPLQDAELSKSILEIFAGRAAVELERQLTEEKLIKAKEASEKANQAKSDFLATMSHEIRTPMNAILGMGELLEETSLNQTQKKYIQTLNRSGKTLMNLINDILDLSKIEAGQFVLEQTVIDLAKLIDETVNLFEFTAKEKGIGLGYHIDPNVSHRVMGDPIRLRQILINLIGNAVKFTKVGEVFLQAQPGQGEETAFFVTDTGIGISDEKQKEIFEPFTQADSSITRLHGGTGLGLTICLRLSNLMGGRITLESTKGKGSTFIFIVPLAKASAKPTPSQDEALADTQLSKDTDSLLDVRILLVEDVEENQMVIQGYLRNEKCHLEIAENGAEALDLFKKQTFDLVLMDIQMPVMDGYESTQQIRAWEKATKAKPTPIIALTAHALTEETGKIKSAGCDSHLTKPLRKKILMEMFAEFIK
ncbi:MAG: response regulator [Magnetococcales bacterium]|nr:response regulator [Magnetococcales bacterium]